jgi:hypothetical protein
MRRAAPLVTAPFMTAGRHVGIGEDWLALRDEPALEPDLPIVDPHHHLCDRAGECCLLHDLLRDIESGHGIRATVFIQCNSRYRASGPAELRPLGQGPRRFPGARCLR